MSRALLTSLAVPWLAACGALVPATDAPPPAPPPSQSALLPGPEPVGPRAFFPDYPERLLFAVAAACADPGQQVVRPDRNTLRCESLPPVEAAASLVLEYDGTIDDLPRFVTAVSSVPQGDGHLVRTDTYIRVPKRTGGVEVIRIEDEELSGTIREVLVRAGGRPL